LSMPVKARLVMKGIVQGVGYRWLVIRAAHNLGISGWVRNAEDGTVEVVCSARDKKHLDDFIERIRRRDELAGPQVQDVIVEPYDGPVGEGFEITR